MIGWQAIVASGGFLCASLIQGLVVLGNESYSPKQWQTAPLFWASIIFAILMNTVIIRLLPKVESFILILHTFGFFAILIPLVYWAPHGDSKTVFTSFLNEGMWPTQGVSVLVGLVGPAFSFLGESMRQKHWRWP